MPLWPSLVISNNRCTTSLSRSSIARQYFRSRTMTRASRYSCEVGAQQVVISCSSLYHNTSLFFTCHCSKVVQHWVVILVICLPVYPWSTIRWSCCQYRSMAWSLFFLSAFCQHLRVKWWWQNILQIIKFKEEVHVISSLLHTFSFMMKSSKVCLFFF